MDLDTFKTNLNYLLENHQHKPYKRQNEGIVFVGLPAPLQIDDRKERYEFVYLLCMFIAFDLKTFEIFDEYYLSLKEQFYIPKFEYGLTNTFVHPNRIFDHYRIGIIEDVFENSFNTFYLFAKELTAKIDTNFVLKTVLDSISEDADLRNGMFGRAFVKYIRNR